MSLWLNSGVPATKVACRAGHGVAVLLKIYAHCIDGQATAANQRIAEALGTGDAEEDPVTRATATPSRHRNRSHRPRPWPFRPRPWLVRARPGAARIPEPGTHGRIADGGGPEMRLEARPRWSARGHSGGASVRQNRRLSLRWFEPNTCHHLRKRPASCEFSC